MRAPLFAFLVSAAFGQELPPAARAILDARHPGWKLAPVDAKIERWFDEYRFKFRPAILPADFDGDGQRDYAVQIAHAGRQIVIALIARNATFEYHRLTGDPPDPFTYLLLYEKGSKDFDFTTLKPFRHAHDSIGVMYFAKTPLTFMYRKNGFRKMLSPSDEE